MKNFLRKTKEVTGKNPFFVIGPSLFPSHYVLSSASDRVVLYGNIAFSVLVLATRKRYSSFLEKVFVFEKIGFKVKVMKTFKISSVSHKKKHVDLYRGLFVTFS